MLYVIQASECHACFVKTRRGGSSTGVHGKSGCYREDQGPCLEAQGDFVSREMMGITGAIICPSSRDYTGMI